MKRRIIFFFVVRPAIFSGFARIFNSIPLSLKDLSSYKAGKKLCNHVAELDNATELLQEFVFGLWRLWKNRNDAIFNGRHQ